MYAARAGYVSRDRKGFEMTTRAYVVLAALSAAFTASTGQASAAELVVDADRAQCPNAQFQSIQAAVAAAAPGDTIKVCPDLYTESVTVNKPLRIHARSGSDHVARCFDPSFAPDPSRHAIVDGQTFAFNLQANGIELEKFIVTGAPSGSFPELVAAIVTSSAFSGYQIRHNTAMDNDRGLFFNSNGAVRSSADHNCFLRNRLGVLAFTLENAGIDHNRFTLNLVGVTLSGIFGAVQGVGISHNESRAERAFASVFGSDAEISHNRVVDSGAAGVALNFGPSRVRVLHNHLLGGQGDGVSIGADHVGLTIAHNRLTGWGQNGIHAGSNSLSDSLVLKNHSESNGRDGIRIDAGGNAGNRLEDNKLRDNAEHDCHDDTLGPGTGGTANLWIRNHGRTENRPGLCVRP
jgi:nitrous oxidase accessory protein NosD